MSRWNFLYDEEHEWFLLCIFAFISGLSVGVASCFFVFGENFCSSERIVEVEKIVEVPSGVVEIQHDISPELDAYVREKRIERGELVKCDWSDIGCGEGGFREKEWYE